MSVMHAYLYGLNLLFDTPTPQINTKSADILYQEAINLGKPTKDTSLLDICCGIGTIGLCFANVSDSHFGQ